MDELEKILSQITPPLQTNTVTSTICEKCKGTGWHVFVKDGVWYQEECDCGQLEKNRYGSRLSFAEIPSLYKDCTFKNYNLGYYDGNDKAKMKAVLSAAHKYVNAFGDYEKAGRGWYIWSRAKGSGKTRLVCTMANALIENHISVKFATAPQILSEIRSTWDRQQKGDVTESKLLNALANVRVLIIDDFGTEQVKDWVDERFYTIINNRYTAKKVTIFTANLPLGEQRYNDRITNRIKETCYVVPFPEISVRDRLGAMAQQEISL